MKYCKIYKCVCVSVIYKYDIILYQGLEHLQSLELCSSQEDLTCPLVLCVNLTSPCSQPCIVTAPFTKTWECGTHITWMIHTGVHEKSRSSSRIHDMTLIGSNIHVRKVWGGEEKGWPGAMVSWWGVTSLYCCTVEWLWTVMYLFMDFVLNVFNMEK